MQDSKRISFVVQCLIFIEEILSIQIFLLINLFIWFYLYTFSLHNNVMKQYLWCKLIQFYLCLCSDSAKCAAFVSYDVKINLHYCVLIFLFVFIQLFLKPRINTKLIKTTGMHKQLVWLIPSCLQIEMKLLNKTKKRTRARRNSFSIQHFLQLEEYRKLEIASS